MIVTSEPGRWFAAVGTDGDVGIFTADGYEVPPYTERLALREILMGATDHD